MKTNIIQLESYDDIISIRDKMSWYPGQRIILIWPKRGKILQSELDLVLLKRAAKNIGSKLALVTHHAVISEWADAANLQVFASISAAKNCSWVEAFKKEEKKFPKGIQSILKEKDKVFPKSKPLGSSRIQRTVAILATLVALIALSVVILPSAEVTYFPETTLQQIEVMIKASEVYSRVNPSGSIPAAMTSLEVSGELASPSSGKTSIPTSKASGSVTFANLTELPLTIPEGTIVSTSITDGKQFVLLENLSLPVGNNETIDGRVDALVPGIEGNIAPNEINSIAGYLETQVNVTNFEEFTGGGGIETPSPNESDYAILKNQLFETLKEQSFKQLQTTLLPGTVMVKESLDLDEILLEEQVNKIGDPADEAVLRMTVRMKVLTFQESDLKTIALLVLNGSLLKGLQPFTDQLTIQQVGEIRFDELGQAYWTMQASRNLVPTWDLELGAQEISGKGIIEARRIISGWFLQSEPARIKLTFTGWPWMPFLSTQIYIINGVKK